MPAASASGDRRSHSLGHHSGGGFLEGPARTEGLADVAIPGKGPRAGQHEVAESGEAGQRVRAAAQRHRQTRDLGEAPGDERANRVVPVAEAIDDP